MSAAPRRLGRVVVLSEHRQSRGTQWDPALDRVLAGRTLGVAFQPILERRQSRDGASRWQPSSAEALVRAYGAGGSTLCPDKLLPAIDRAGLMHRLFLFVLTQSLAALQTWERTAGLRLDVAVNLHTAALLDDALPRCLLGLLDAAACDPKRLTLELTENAPIADLQHAASNVRALRSAGVRIALDDFGAGFSTTTRLRWLECDELKIDRVLVHALERSDEQRYVVEHLVGLAHSRGMTACAEGVETEATLRLLGTLGCDRVQGYLCARPQAPESIPDVVRAWRERSNLWQAPPDAQLSLPGLSLQGAHWADEPLSGTPNALS